MTNKILIKRLAEILQEEDLQRDCYSLEERSEMIIKKLKDFGLKLQFASHNCLEEELDYWPEDNFVFDKLKCQLNIFSRVYWFYRDEEKYARDCNTNIRQNPTFSGIIIPRPDIEFRGGELDIEDCLVCIDRMPCEKCYPEISYIAIAKLIDDPDLVEVFGGKC